MRKRAVAAWKRLISTWWGRLVVVLGLAGALWLSSWLNFITWAHTLGPSSIPAAIVLGICVPILLLVIGVGVYAVVIWIMKGAS